MQLLLDPATSVEDSSAADYTQREPTFRPTIDEVVWWRPDMTTRQRVLLTAHPLLHILRLSTHIPAEDAAKHFDYFALAFKAIDLIVENTGLEHELDRDELRRDLEPLMSAMDRSAGVQADADAHERAVERLLAWLMNDEAKRDPFAIEYSDVRDGSVVRLTHRVRLIYEYYHPDGRIVLRLSREAIVLYLRALDEDIEDQQAATEAIVRSQIARGRFDEAVRSSENALLLSRAYREKVTEVLRQTRMNIREVDWANSVLGLLDEAAIHIKDRLLTERSVVETTRERLASMDPLSDDAGRLQRVAKLMQMCFDQHMELQEVVIRAPNTFLSEDAEQGYVPASSRNTPHFLTDILQPMLSMPFRDAVDVADTVEAVLLPPTTPEVFWLSWYIGRLLQPRQVRAPLDIEDSALSVNSVAPERLRFSPHEWERSGAYLHDGESLLSDLLERAVEAGEARSVLDLIALRALYAFAPDKDDRSKIGAITAGGAFSVAGIVGDDLILMPAESLGRKPK